MGKVNPDIDKLLLARKSPAQNPPANTVDTRGAAPRDDQSHTPQGNSQPEVSQKNSVWGTGYPAPRTGTPDPPVGRGGGPAFGQTPFGGYEHAQDLSPDERAALEIAIDKGVASRLKAAQSIAPSVRQQSQAEMVNLTLAYERMGNPFSQRRIPFSVLRDMATDPMIAFAFHYTTVPLVRANWRIECADAQIAAAVDAALRPVNPILQTQLTQKLLYGYQPMCKRFKLGPIDGYYRDPQGKKPLNDIPIWPQGSADALLWDIPYVLAPEHVMPRWNERGGFNGFYYSIVPLPNPIQIGLANLYGYAVVPGFEITSEFAMWAVNERQQAFGCQPPDELVLTTHGYKPIGDLDPQEDRLVSYDSKGMHEIRRGFNTSGSWVQIAQQLRDEGKTWKEVADATGLNSAQAARGRMTRWLAKRDNGNGSFFEKTERPYSGELLTISTGDKHIRVTPNHKFSVRWTSEANDKWVVYIMRQGNWWRIGISHLHPEKSHANSGVGNRLGVERAEAAWVVDTFATKKEAIFHESLWSRLYGIPDICFRATKGCTLDDDDLALIWDQLDSETGAIRLLHDHHRDENFPMYQRRQEGSRSRPTQAGKASWTCVAANMLPGLMEIPTDPGEGMKPDWKYFEITRENYEGTVVSLEVVPHHHYISNGIVTQNSLFGSPRTARAYRFWWSYWYLWAICDRAFENNADPPKRVYYPADIDEVIDPNDPDIANNPTAKRLQAVAIALGERARSGATLAIPGGFIHDESGKMTGQREWDIDYLKPTADFAAMQGRFSYLDSAKFRAMLVPEQAFIEGGSSSSGSKGGTSRLMGIQLGEVYQEAQQLLADENDAEINDYMIPQFIAANFPDRAGIQCRKVTEGFGAYDVELMKQIIQLAGQVKGNLLPVDMRSLLDQAGMPLLSKKEFDAELAQIVKTAEAMNPVQAPPQKVGMEGYNAGVEKTATGMSYVQPSGRIDLDLHSAGEGLTDRLPKVPAYQDAAVRAQMLKLRKFMSDRYQAQISSFTEGLKSQQSLHLASSTNANSSQGKAAQAGTTTSQSQKMTPTQATGVASAVVSTWRANNPLTGANILGGILLALATRGAQRELKEARLSAPVDDIALTAWANDHATEALSSVDETLDDEFITFLRDEIQAGKDPAEIAEDALEHFSDTPRSHADRVVLTETLPAYNHGMLTALHAAGVSQVMARDASDGMNQLTDAECKARNGKVFSIEQAIQEKDHPNGTLHWTPLATDAFRMLREKIPAELNGKKDQLVAYDSEREILYITEDVTDEQETEFSLTIGELLRLK